jgi:hypothetical protein
MYRMAGAPPEVVRFPALWTVDESMNMSIALMTTRALRGRDNT